MRFKLLSGTHSEKGKIYTKGQIVESELDLVDLFIFKFEKIQDQISTPDVEPKKRERVGKKKKAKKKTSSAEDARGVDVTDNWPVAKENSLKVFKRGTYYHVFEDGATAAVNGKGLKKNKVSPFLNSYLEE